MTNFNMETSKEHLFEILYQTFHLPLSKIKTLKDYYAHFNYIDISKLKMDILIEKKAELEWAAKNPDFDFNSILKTDYTNEMLYNWLMIQYENTFFVLEKYQKEKFILTSDDVVKSYLPEGY